MAAKQKGETEYTESAKASRREEFKIDIPNIHTYTYANTTYYICSQAEIELMGFCIIGGILHYLSLTI